jgi:hypothetical protein
MRSTTHPLRLVALLASLAACATARTSPRPAHGRFDPTQGKGIAAGALQAVKAAGFDLAFHDAQRGLILTRTREGQAACGRGECLTRDTFVVRLEAGGATAVLSRQVFDDALRAWESPRSAADLDAVEADEVALLRAFLAEPPVLRLSRSGESCSGPEHCEAGLACEGRRCRATRASSPASRVPAAGSKH